MKELLEFFRDRMTNKFFVPFVFFFVVSHWQIFIWLLMDKNHASVIENISFYVSQRGYICLIGGPLLDAIAFAMISPWLSLGIEFVIDYPNKMRIFRKIEMDQMIADKKIKLADTKIELIEKEEDISGVESKKSRRNRDITIFGNLSSRMDEAQFKMALDVFDGRGDLDSFEDAVNRLSAYAYYASLVDQRYYDEVLQEKSKNVVDEISNIFIISSNSGRPRPDITNDQIRAGLKKVRQAYEEYRMAVRDRLGI